MAYLHVRAESLDKPMPELVEDAFTRLGAEGASAATAATAGGGGGGGQQQQGGGGAGGDEGPVFEDQETRGFYESLPDVK